MRSTYLLIFLLAIACTHLPAQNIGAPVWDWVNLMEGQSSWYEGIEGSPQLAPHTSGTLLLGAVDGPHPMVVNGDTVSTSGKDGVWLSVMDTSGSSIKSSWITSSTKIDLFSVIPSDKGTFYILVQSEGNVTWDQQTSWNTNAFRYQILEVDTNLNLLERSAFSHSTGLLMDFAQHKDSLFALSIYEDGAGDKVFMVDDQLNLIRELKVEGDLLWPVQLFFGDSSLYVYGGGYDPTEIYAFPFGPSLTDTFDNSRGFVANIGFDGSPISFRAFPFVIGSLIEDNAGNPVLGGMAEDSFSMDGIHYIPPQPFTLPASFAELDKQLQIKKWITYPPDSAGISITCDKLLLNPDSSFTALFLQNTGSFTGAPLFTPAMKVFFGEITKTGQLVTKEAIAEYSMDYFPTQFFSMNGDYYFSSLANYKAVFSDSIIDLAYESGFWGKLGDYTHGLTVSIPYIPGGVNDPETRTPLLAYPNPTTGLIHFKSDITLLKVTAFDVTGRQISVPFDSSSCNLSQLPDGMYWLEVISADQKHFVVSILKK